MTDPLSGWSRFSRAVKQRLQAGRAAYGDKSFARHPGSLLREIQAELLDVCGWSFILSERLRRVEQAMATAATAPAPAPSVPSTELATPTPSTTDDPGLHLALEPHEVAMLDALSERFGCSRAAILRQGLHLLFRLTFADKFAPNGSAPIVTGATNRSLPEHDSGER